MMARLRLTPTLSLLSRDTLMSTDGFLATDYFGANCDVAPDMKRVLALLSDTDDYQLVVSPNWITELRRKVAENGGGK